MRCWNIAYYSGHFDVNTHEVLRRFKLVFLPINSDKDFFNGKSPDLYCPFWIATSLIFLLSVVGNIATYEDNDDFEDWSPEIVKFAVAS